MATSFVSLLKQKQGFLLAVYATLIGQLLFTFAIVYGLRNTPYSVYTNQSIWLYLFVSLALLFVLLLVPMPTYAKLIVFTVFSFVEGCLLNSVANLVPEEIINQALIGSISIFVGMSIFAIILASVGIDLSFLGIYLLGALTGLLIASIVVMLLGKKTTKGIYKAITILGLTLFSIFVIYDTNIILQKNNTETFVEAALGFYLDFINIFVRLLSLEGGN